MDFRCGPRRRPVPWPSVRGRLTPLNPAGRLEFRARPVGPRARKIRATEREHSMASWARLRGAGPASLAAEEERRSRFRAPGGAGRGPCGAATVLEQASDHFALPADRHLRAPVPLRLALAEGPVDEPAELAQSEPPGG